MIPMEPFRTYARVKVIGVGGAGCNAVTHMILAGLPHVQFIAVDTDPTALAVCRAPVKVWIGSQLNKESGTSGDSAADPHTAERSGEELRDVLRGADMIFITAGMGGDAGGRLAPVVARIARESGAVTVGVITKPFSFEGRSRQRSADQGARAFKVEADTLIALSNDRLLVMADKKLTMSTAFALADQVMGTAIRSISGILTAPGLLTLSFGEMRRLLATGGRAAIGIGRASGPGRAAASRALNSPLLEGGPAGADSLLFTFAGGNYTSFEVTQAAAAVMAAAGGGNSACLGARIDAGLGDEVEVLVLATGIHEGPHTQRNPWLPPGGPPNSGPSPSDQRIPRRPPMNPSAGAAQAAPSEPIPYEADAVGAIGVPWLRPDRPAQGGAHPR